MRRDRGTLILMLILPIIQLLIFGFAINLDVKNLPTAIYDSANGQESRELITKFKNSGILVKGKIEDEVVVNKALIPEVIGDRVQITIILRLNKDENTINNA